MSTASDLTEIRRSRALVGCCAGPAGPTGATGPAGATGVPAPTGNTLTVDAVYGNDATASADHYNVPFLTINAALALATTGELVFLRPGSYQGPITIPTGVAIRGASVQVTSINALNVSASTTLVTMGTQTRLEDLTLNLTSSADVNLVGVDFPSGTPQTVSLARSLPPSAEPPRSARPAQPVPSASLSVSLEDSPPGEPRPGDQRLRRPRGSTAWGEWAAVEACADRGSGAGDL